LIGKAPERTMKTSRTIRFIIAAMLFTAGAVSLLYGQFTPATLCFTLPGVVLMRRSELSNPISRRDAFGILISLLVLVAAILLLTWMVPNLAEVERIARQPAFVATVWISAIIGLYLGWRKEANLSAA
jgi:hypothetical protein